jgi:integrase
VRAATTVRVPRGGGCKLSPSRGAQRAQDWSEPPTELSFFTPQARRGWISANPFPQLTRDDRPKPDDDDEPPYEWSDDDVRRLLDASRALAAKPTSRYDYTPIITLALDTGQRQSELMGLTWADVDLAEGVINVRQQFGRARKISAPKTKAGRRRVPLVPGAVAMLRRHRLASKFSADTDYVFASKSGAPLQHRNLTRRGWEAARDAAGLPRMGFHQTRHCFASRAIAAGGAGPDARGGSRAPRPIGDAEGVRAFVGSPPQRGRVPCGDGRRCLITYH